MKTRLSLLFAFLATFVWSVGDGACENAQHLFSIARSKNGNIVQYDARTTQDGNLAGEAPVFAYWVLENGERNELSTIQRIYAYGIEDQKRLEKNRCEIVLSALTDRKITVKKTARGYRAFVLINGREGILERVYVESREGLMGLPRVQYVDLFGRDGQSRLPVTERIFPNQPT